MPAASQIKVLVVDDQLTIRSLARSTLQQLGFTDITDAGDGEEGFKSLLAKPAHLVISDYNMPKMDGLGFLRAVRAHPDAPRIPNLPSKSLARQPSRRSSGPGR